MRIYIKHINSTQREDNQGNYMYRIGKYVDGLVSIRCSYEEVCMLLLYRYIVNNISNLRKKKIFTGILGV